MVAASACAVPSVQTLLFSDAVTKTHNKACDLLHDSLGYAIKRAQVRTYEVLFGLLGENPITPGRMTALCLIARQPGISQSELADLLDITRAAVVKVVDTLETRSLIERQPIIGNRRTYALQVTKAGYDELHRLTTISREYERRISANLTCAERQQLMTLLERVAAASFRNTDNLR